MQETPSTSTFKTLPIVAAFDFDGTLSYKDTLLPFLKETCGGLNTYLHLSMLLPVFAGFLCKVVTRQKAKETVLKNLIGGKKIDDIRNSGHAFAYGPLNKLIKPEALEKLRWHQKEGHRCILVSASLDVYLKPWAEKEGFQDVITSKLDAPSGIVSGQLKGLNCWGPEKVRRLDELLGSRKNYQLYAYGDSKGDRDLLAYADHPFYRKF